MSTQIQPYGGNLTYEEQQSWQRSGLPYDQWFAYYHQQNLAVYNNQTTINNQNSGFWEIWHALATSALIWFLLIGCQLWIPALALAIIALIIYSVYKILEGICKLLVYPFKQAKRGNYD